MIDAVSLLTTEAPIRMARTVGLFTRSALYRIDLAQQVSAVCTRVDVVLTDVLTARLTLGNVGCAVQFITYRTRGLVRSTEYVPTRRTVGTIVPTDSFTAPIAGC
jgi:hypothetical protein